MEWEVEREGGRKGEDREEGKKGEGGRKRKTMRERERECVFANVCTHMCIRGQRSSLSVFHNTFHLVF